MILTTSAGGIPSFSHQNWVKICNIMYFLLSFTEYHPPRRNLKLHGKTPCGGLRPTYILVGVSAISEQWLPLM